MLRQNFLPAAIPSMASSVRRPAPSVAIVLSPADAGALSPVAPAGFYLLDLSGRWPMAAGRVDRLAAGAALVLPSHRALAWSVAYAGRPASVAFLPWRGNGFARVAAGADASIPAAALGAWVATGLGEVLDGGGAPSRALSALLRSQGSEGTALWDVSLLLFEGRALALDLRRDLGLLLLEAIDGLPAPWLPVGGTVASMSVRQVVSAAGSGGLGLSVLRRWLLRLIQALRRLEHRMDLASVRRMAGVLAPFVTRAGLLAWRRRAERESLSRAAAWASVPPPALARGPLAIVLRDEGPSAGPRWWWCEASMPEGGWGLDDPQALRPLGSAAAAALLEGAMGPGRLLLPSLSLLPLLELHAGRAARVPVVGLDALSAAAGVSWPGCGSLKEIGEGLAAHAVDGPEGSARVLVEATRFVLGVLEQRRLFGS
jgi:hypothetical protein